jgi:hypothetical protein
MIWCLGQFIEHSHTIEMHAEVCTRVIASSVSQMQLASCARDAIQSNACQVQYLFDVVGS